MAGAEQPSVTMYTADVSICSQICRLAVHEHGVSWAENVNVDIEYAMDNFEPWFVRLQPKMTVPVLKFDEDLFGDSREIMMFLAERYPERGLRPDGIATDVDAFVDDFYAKFGQIGAFTFANLIQRSPEIQQFVERGKGQVTIAKLEALAATDEFAAVAGPKLQSKRNMNFTAFMQSQDTGKLDEFMRNWLNEMADKLADARPFMLGATYTLADVVATAFCARIHFIKGEDMFPDPVTRYWHSMKGRPSFRAANVCSVWEDALMSKQFDDFVAGKTS